MSLTYAPDEQSLWSLSLAGELTVRAGDGKTVNYQGKVPAFAVLLRVLKDGSFLVGTSDDSLQWFEPPRAGEPLQLRREFDGPEARGLKKRANPRANEPATDEEKRAAIDNLRFNDLVISPDEKRVAYSLSKSNVFVGAIIYDTPTKEVIRVWNLASGQVESEHVVKTPTLSVKQGGLSDAKLSGPVTFDEISGFPEPGTKLAWADDETLVVARGLSLERFDAATGAKRSEWKPADAVKDLGRAFDVDAQKLLALSSDGKQLLVLDGAHLLTLWNSQTGEARVLSDDSGVGSGGSEFVPEAAPFVPWKAKFSPDGTKVAAWERDDILVWSLKGQMMVYASDAGSKDVALTNAQIAYASGSEVSTIPFFMEKVGRIMRADKPER